MDGNFTYKSQEVIMLAQSIAQERGQHQIDALHLLLALIVQEGSVVLTILQKLGVDIENLKNEIVPLTRSNCQSGRNHARDYCLSHLACRSR